MGFAFGSTHPTRDWRASSQPVGWVERSETHHPATRAPPRKAMGFAFGSTHPTNGLAGVLAARRMGRAQRNPSSRDPDPAAQSDGFRLWLYPSYGLAYARRMGSAQRNPSSRDPGPAAKAMGFAFGSTHPTAWHQARSNSLRVFTRSPRSSGVYGRAAPRPQTGPGQAGPERRPAGRGKRV